MFFQIVMQIVLWLWFFGCIKTYRIKNHVLVEGMGVKSAEFGMLVFYSVGIILQLLFPWGKWYQLGVLIFWIAVQFICHWRYTIFGASPAKLKGYNECFEKTVKLFPASETRILPDLYHVVLHLMIIVNVLLLLFI